MGNELVLFSLYWKEHVREFRYVNAVLFVSMLCTILPAWMIDRLSFLDVLSFSLCLFIYECWFILRPAQEFFTYMVDLFIHWLIIYGFTSRSRIFHFYGDVTIAGEGLQNLGLCLALRAFEQGGIFIVPHLLWHGTSVFPVSSEGPPLSVAFYDTHGDAEDLFQPGSSRG